MKFIGGKVCVKTVFATFLALLTFSPSRAVAGASLQAATSCPAHLTRGATTLALPLVAETSGEAILRLTVQAPGTDWGERGKEAAVLEVIVDNHQPLHVVLYMGATLFTHTITLGPVEQGNHQLKVVFVPEKSATGAQEVLIQSAQFTLVPASSAEHVVLAHAPLLYGRNENSHSDVPLVMYYQDQLLSNGHRRIVYSVIWSNEDGGTNTLGLITTWGRTTDIEWIYDVTLASDGTIEKAVYQAPSHQVKPFSGRWIGKHPILRTATTNNNVVDSGSSRLFFGMYPTQALPKGASREVMMDLNPWTYQVAATELAREGKQRSAIGVSATDLRLFSVPRMVADLRKYVYIDFTAQNNNGYIGFALKRRNDPTWYGWYPKNGITGISRNGSNRVAVELPDGTTQEDLEALRAYTRPSSGGNGYSVKLTDINKVFMLNDAYVPHSSVVSWHGSLILNAANDNQVVWQISSVE